MWMLGALWLVVAHDLSEYRYMDDVTRNLFSLFCSTWRAVLKMFVGLFRIKASEILEKSSTRGNYNRKKKWRKGDKKKTLDYFRMPKLREIFTTAAIVFHRYERLAVLQMFSPLFCFEQEKTLKNFSKKLYTNTIKKREEPETKNSVCNLKKCLKTSTNPRTVKRYEAGMCIGLFSFLIIV